jgi:hypothetical protein
MNKNQQCASLARSATSFPPSLTRSQSYKSTRQIAFSSLVTTSLVGLASYESPSGRFVLFLSRMIDKIPIERVEEEGEGRHDPNKMLSFYFEASKFASFDLIDVLVDCEDVIQATDQMVLL